MKYIVSVLVLATFGFAACGGSDTTTVVQPDLEGVTVPDTPTEAATPVEDTQEWPMYLQNAFTKGCGGGARCYCALDSLMQDIPADELIVTGNITARYHEEMVNAVRSCL